MNSFKKITSILMVACLILSCAFITTGNVISGITVSAENTENTVTNMGNSAISYKNYVFNEDFSGDLSKWRVENSKNNDSYISDFTIVADPENPDNKCLTFTRLGTLLVMANEVWPADGMLKYVKFRMKFMNESFQNYGSGLSFSYKDNENMQHGWFYSDTSLGGNAVNGLYMRYSNLIEGAESGRKSGTPSCVPIHKTEWLDVELTYSDTSIKLIMSDSDDNMYTDNMPNTFLSGRFALGYTGLYQDNATIGNGQYYIDDVSVEFKQLSVDLDDEIKDVEVYYSGNTYLEPGDLVSITGEKLGQSVSSAEILHLDGNVSAPDNLKYFAEQDYHDATDNTTYSWDDLKDMTSASPESLEIVQRTVIGVKFKIPENYPKGIYAVRLNAAAPDGKGAIVVLNNPKIDFLSHNDGEAATSQNGWLKIAGNNLSVQDDISKISAVITDSAGNKTLVDNSAIFAYTTENNASKNNEGKENEYYVKVNLPNLAVGDYTVSLHNGFGGDIGWSVPYKFSVKEKSAREIWNEKGNIYNVKDYGAEGSYDYGNTTHDANPNDTAAIIAALEAASETGGTVYFPAGHYRIVDTLYIPDNITLLGDTNYQSGIFFDDVGMVDIPEAMVYYGNNVEIKNMYFYGGFSRSLFKQKESLANEKSHIYFENVRCVFDPSISCSNNGRAYLMDGYTYIEAQIYLKSLSQTYGYEYIKNPVSPEFLSFDKLSIYYASGYTSNLGGVIGMTGKYIDVTNTDWNGFGSGGAQAAGFIDNATWQGCFAWKGNTMYTNCNGGNGTNNNREIFTTDGHSRDPNSIVQNLNHINWNDEEEVKKILGDEYTAEETYVKDGKTLLTVRGEIKKFTEENKGTAYRVMNRRVYQTGAYADSYKVLYVHNGQGMGQVRDIDSITQIGNYSYLDLRSPFAVEPNRNSKVYFHPKRYNMYAVANNFYNGRHTGTFGTAVDAVFDDITFRETAAGVELHTCQSAVWYVTCRENDSDDIITGRTNILYTEGFSMLTNGGAPVNMSFAGIQWRDNNIGPGGFMIGNFGGGDLYGMEEIIIEDNTFETDRVDGIKGFTNTGAQVEGVYFENNIAFMENGETTDPYSSETTSALRSGTTNKFGSLRQMCDVISPTAQAARQYGDVNNDGRVSIKDVTILRYYFTGQFTPTGNDKAIATWNNYADCNRDGVVNSLDIFAIFCKILGEDYNGETVGGGSSGGSTGSDPSEPEIDFPEIPERVIKIDEAELDYSGVEDEGDPIIVDFSNDTDTLDYSAVNEED